MAFFGLSNLIWLIAAILLTLLGLLYRNRMLRFNLIVLALGIPFALRLFAFNSPNPTSSGALRITSFNTHALGGVPKHNTSEDIEHFLDTSNTSCAALIEWRFNMGKISKKLYPFQYNIRPRANQDNGILMVSKYPIVNSGLVTFKTPSYNMAGYIDIRVNDQTIRVYGIHLETTRIKSYHFHNLKRLEFDSVYTENAKNIIQRLRYSMQLRAEQVETLKVHMEECPYPSIIIGDFNDTPQSYAYQQLRMRKKDAFAEAGKGFEATFLKPFPLLRIDHILYDNSLDCVGYYSTDDIYSDHKLIFAQLDFKQD